jgi:hypothetical protein
VIAPMIWETSRSPGLSHVRSRSSFDLEWPEKA